MACPSSGLFEETSCFGAVLHVTKNKLREGGKVTSYLVALALFLSAGTHADGGGSIIGGRLAVASPMRIEDGSGNVGAASRAIGEGDSTALLAATGRASHCARHVRIKLAGPVISASIRGLCRVVEQLQLLVWGSDRINCLWNESRQDRRKEIKKC